MRRDWGAIVIGVGGLGSAPLLHLARRGEPVSYGFPPPPGSAPPG